MSQFYGLTDALVVPCTCHITWNASVTRSVHCLHSKCCWMANAEASGDVRLYCRVLVLQYWSLKKSEKLLLLLAYYSNLITARTLRDFLSFLYNTKKKRLQTLRIMT
jgi:hypothetical protein